MLTSEQFLSRKYRVKTKAKLMNRNCLALKWKLKKNEPNECISCFCNFSALFFTNITQKEHLFCRDGRRHHTSEIPLSEHCHMSTKNYLNLFWIGKWINGSGRRNTIYKSNKLSIGTDTELWLDLTINKLFILALNRNNCVQLTWPVTFNLLLHSGPVAKRLW